MFAWFRRWFGKRETLPVWATAEGPYRSANGRGPWHDNGELTYEVPGERYGCVNCGMEYQAGTPSRCLKVR